MQVKMDVNSPLRYNYYDPLSQFILELNNVVFNTSLDISSIQSCKIRLRTKNLNGIGDLNFPVGLARWQELLEKSLPQQEPCKLPESPTVFNLTSYEGSTLTGKCLLNSLFKLNSVEDWSLKVEKICLFKYNVYLFFDRVPMFTKIIDYVMHNPKFYSARMANYKIAINKALKEKPLCDISLTELRLAFLELFTTKLTTALHDPDKQQEVIRWSQRSSDKNKGVLLCGPVLGRDGLKDAQTSAEQLLVKRSNDMRLIAEHRYKLNVDKSSNWEEYFRKIGRAAVIVHMLQQKPHKEIKVSVRDISTTHKGPEFVFYNCARLGNLLKQYDRNVKEGIYPDLPQIKEVNFSLLDQPEEWQLFYVYIVQFPFVVKSCLSINDKTKSCEILPQNLTMFLSGLACTYSTYYGRVKILTEPREHIFPTLHARIYLLKALQMVFHYALDFLDVEPIQQM